MYSFIALAKQSNFETTTTETLLIEDKQRSQRNSRLFPKLTEALTKKITEALSLLGFKQVASEIPVDKQVSNSDKQALNFMPLNYLGAYVVNSSDKKKIKEAQEPFDELNCDVINLTFIKVMFTLLKALPQSVSCYENAFCFQKVS